MANNKPNQPEPNQPEPNQPEPNRAEPNSAEPNRAEPNKAEPNRVEPMQQDQNNSYQTIIEQQQAQINALIAQTETLNKQIINMVNSGAQFNDNSQPTQPTQPISLSDDMDYSLESLAKDIGRK